MRKFLETTFGPTELSILDEVLNDWVAKHGFELDSAERELAAAVIINLFREGHDTAPTLRNAVGRHQALMDLARSSS